MRTFHRFITTSLLLIFAAPVTVAAWRVQDGAAVARMRGDLTFLASNELEGRGAGTPSADVAAAWIAARFASLGLKPAGANGEYYQKFNLPAARRVRADKSILATIQIGGGSIGKDSPGTDQAAFTTDVQEADLIPTLASSVGKAAGVPVDIGDGSDFKNPMWNESSPKIAVARLPKAEEGNANNPHGFGTGVRMLAFGAKQHGAKGLICVIKDPSEIQPESGESRDAGIPIIYAKENVLPLLLKTYKILEFDPCVEHVSRATKNILAIVPGTKADGEIIVIGAHYDHLGWGGSDSRSPGERAIHHGADDNASGTTIMLELANRFANKAGKLDRTIVFAAWGAEEMGLLGSDYWVKNPTVDWKRVVANFNFDMLGRSTDRKLILGGIGSSPEFEGLMEAANATLKKPLTLAASKTLTTLGGSSDHRSFIAKQKPAIFFFTGLHEDYHKPSDTSEKIQYETMADIADFSQFAMEKLANDPRPITWANLPMEPAPTPAAVGAEQGLRAWFGSIPDYAAEDGGVVLSGTSKGSPAEKAGLLAKDILIQVGEFKIDNINDFTLALGKLKPGQEIEVTYKRDGETKKLKLTLAARR